MQFYVNLYDIKDDLKILQQVVSGHQPEFPYHKAGQIMGTRVYFSKNWQCWLLLFALVISLYIPSAPVKAAATSGYLEYFIAGGEEQMWGVFFDLDPYLLDVNQGMRAVISFTATSADTLLYYDHWEDGYDFDPGSPASADESYTLARGEVKIFTSANIPVNPRGSNTYYDGRDRVLVVGGMPAVSRVSWPESAGTLFAQAWEVFPTKPYQNQYTLPVGEDLAGAPTYYTDFTKSYLIVQSTAANNRVQIDDPLTVPNPDVDVVLQLGEVTELYHVNAGTTINATYPVQAQMIVGNDYGGTAHYESRDLTLVPTSLWANEYYSPVGGFGSGYDTDLFIVNPYAYDLDVSYSDSLGSGTLTVPANSTRAYSSLRGQSVPQNSGVHLSAAQNFWAVGVADTESTTYDWAFSLVPVTALTDEYYLGWAPGSSQAVPTVNGSPAFVTPVQDGTTVFVDFGPNDGVVDRIYTLDRLQIQKIFDPDFNNTGMHIWATDPLAVAWGEDPNTAGTASPYLDMGNTTLPLQNTWMDAVVSIEKSASPSLIAANPGQQVAFTLVVNSHEFSLDSVDVSDSLPTNWTYVSGSTTITYPDNSTLSGAAADPAVNGLDLLWDLNLPMNAGETLTIVFTGETTAQASGSHYINTAQANALQGSILITASDSAPVEVYDLALEKTTHLGSDPLAAGNTVTYTIAIENLGSVAETNLVLSDVLPAGLTAVPGSTVMLRTSAGLFSDRFASISYAGSDGTMPWATSWLEVDEADGANSGDLRVVTDLGDYSLRVKDNGSSNTGEGVQRDLNLSAYSSATFSFDYRRVGLTAADRYVAVLVSNDGGSNWTELDRFAGAAGGVTDAGYTSVNYDISAYIASNTRILFMSAPDQGNDETVYFDNIQVQAAQQVQSPGHDLPGLLTPADAYSLLPGERLEISYRAIVNNPPPPGVRSVTNIAYLSSDNTGGKLLEARVTNQLTGPTALRLVQLTGRHAAPAPWLVVSLVGALLVLLSLAAPSFRLVWAGRMPR